MALDVHVNQPVFSYLVWLDGQGRVVPLYPWNFDRPDVTDIEQPPPKRIPTNILMSPPPGSGWDFGEQGGMETVLFLIRKTPLPEGTSVGKLIGDLPSPVPVREPAELAVFEVKDKAKSVTTVVSQARGDQAAAKAADEPLKAMLLRLSPHFDLVRAVRFAHVGAEPPAQE